MSTYLDRGTVAIFDLDRTLVPGSSLVHLGRALVREGHLRRRAAVGHAVRNAVFARRGATDATAARLRDSALAAFAGAERAPVVRLALEVAQDVAARVYPAARWLIERHLVAGDFCVVLSSSPHELVEAVARQLGVHRAVGTRAEVVDGCFTGRLSGSFCYGAGKLERLRAEMGPIELSSAYAYADSASDLPLLRACGNPVAVNPDRHLRSEAEEAGWAILDLG